MKSTNTTTQINSMSTVIRAATATATVLFLLASSNVPSCDAFALTTPSSSSVRGGSVVLDMDKSSSKKKRTASPAGFASKLQEMQASKFPYAGEVRPGQQSPQRQVLDSTISRPDYADTGVPVRGNKPMLPWIVEVKNAEQIEKMRASGKLARYILDLGGAQVKPGVTTDEIDKVVHDAVVAAGAYPSPLNYHGFPKSCCTSVNEVICHGIPDDRPLKEGDIINLDITVYLDGFHGDCSEMFVAGEPDDQARALLQTTYDSWISACLFVKPGNDYKDIGAIIEDVIVPRGFSTVRNFCGHGIGQTFHTNPNILHYRNNEPNGQMTVGHTFTIEPMICEKSAKAVTWPDEWTATTVDGKRSAQFEHTLLVTPDGVEALTGKNEDSPLQFWERDSKIHKGIWLGTSAAAMQRQAAINAVKLA